MHLDIDSFFVSCERLGNSALNNQPLIIGGSRDRGIVASCSREARLYNVRVGMPIALAQRLCPEAKIIKGDMELYTKKSLEITEIIKEKAPIMEKSSIDEFYIDISGMDRYIGSIKWSNELADKILQESGLPISYGLSINKTVSKIASAEAKPIGRKEIPSTFVKPFLNPLPVRRIPKVGQQTANSLHRIGIRKIQTLAEMPLQALVALIGERGKTIWQRANGIDETAVVEFNESKSISIEKSFQKDTIDIIKLKACISRMVEKLCFDLRKTKRLTSIVSIKIKYTNFDTESLKQRINYTSRDDMVLPVLYQLFDKLYQRRMRLRSIGISFSGLVGGHYQIDIFNDCSEAISLYQAIDKIKQRFGEKYIHRGSSLNDLLK